MLDYYVDYYDMNDGWLGWDYVNEFRKDRIFTDYNEAVACQNKLNSEMSFDNVHCGEYYAVKSHNSEQSKTVDFSGSEDFIEVCTDNIKLDADFTIC